jgi:glycosyltransferase involved in cell wall biosynthesis
MKRPVSNANEHTLRGVAVDDQDTTSVAFPDPSTGEASNRAMSKTPLVSIVIPYYNEQLLLTRAIHSVLSQDVNELEVIVVDDASTYPACDYIVDDPRVRVVRHSVNQHAAGARNTGISAASGEYIAFLDADDEYLPGKLSSELSVFAKHPEVGMVGSDGLVVQSDGYPDGEWHMSEAVRHALGGRSEVPVVLPPCFIKSVAQHYPFHTCAFTTRAAILRELRGFNSNFRCWEEWDLQFRIALKYPCAYLPQSTYRYIKRAGSITGVRDPQKYLSGAEIAQGFRAALGETDKHLIQHLNRVTAHNLLQACETMRGRREYRLTAWRSACRSLYYQPSLWGVRALIRTALALLYPTV